jgi:hypothetical protein
MAYKLMQARYLGAVAAYIQVKAENDGLSKALTAIVGEEAVGKLKQGEPLEIPRTDVDENENTVEKTVTIDPVKAAFSYLFDETNKNFSRRTRDNVIFLYQTQKWANKHLKIHGHLFLNELLVRLGLSPVKEGQTHGWVYDPKNPEKIDFGIFRTDASSATIRFIDGIEDSVWITLNVDGCIIDKLGWSKR